MAEHVFSGHGRRQVFKPVGRCIYCGTDQGQLTEEHIIPEGLGGNMILPKASCGACQKIINEEIENPIQRASNGMLGPAKARMGFRGKNRGKVKSKRFVSLTIESPDGTTRTEVLEGSNIPLAFLGVISGPPGLTVGRTILHNHKVECWMKYNTEELEKIAKPGEKVTGLGAYNFRQFYRLIAKIAHSAAYATYPYERIRPFLRGLILGSDSDLFRYIGSQQVPLGDPKGHHQVTVGGMPLVGGGILPPDYRHNAKHLASIVRLFCNHGTPEYLIIVGEIEGSLHEKLSVK